MLPPLTTANTTWQKYFSLFLFTRPGSGAVAAAWLYDYDMDVWQKAILV